MISSVALIILTNEEYNRELFIVTLANEYDWLFRPRNHIGANVFEKYTDDEFQIPDSYLVEDRALSCFRKWSKRWV